MQVSENSILRKPAHWVRTRSDWQARWLAFVLGVLYVGGFAPFHVWALTLLALTGLVWLLDGAAKKPPSIKKAAWIGWWFGFGQFLAGTYWVGSAFVERGAAYVWMMPFGVAFMAAGLALFWMAGTALAMRFWSRRVRRVWVLALCLFLVEWLRGHILTGFPWNTPGLIWQPGGAISQSASFLGAWGLGLVTLMAFTGPAALTWSQAGMLKRATPAILGFVAFAVLYAWGLGRLANADDKLVPGVKIRVVQAQIDQRKKWLPQNRQAIVDKYLQLSSGPGLGDVNYVVWPEGALPMLMLEEPQVLDQIASRFGDGPGLITGLTRRELMPDNTVEFRNSLGVFSFKNGIPRLELLYDKAHLTPFGEYLPFGRLLAKTGISALTRLGEGFTPGPGPVTASLPGVPRVNPQICYEVIFPGFTPTGADRPGWIVNVTNDSWFGASSGPYQHVEQAQYRAIEEGLPVVRSASSGVSGLIDPYGRMPHAMGRSRNSHEDVNLPRALNATFYSKKTWGPVVLWLVFCIAMFMTPRKPGNG